MRKSLAALLLAILAACGPIDSTSKILNAAYKLRAAKDAEGARYAPWEFYSAEQYLYKARELQGYSRFEESIDDADKAYNFADSALKKALAAPRK